jgi:hypothetical protein
MTPPKNYTNMNRTWNRINDSTARARKLPRLKINVNHNEQRISPAFWFAQEEPEHARAIVTAYEELLGIDKNRLQNSRLPKLFIGKIKRTVLDDRNIDSFYTFDIVNVYMRDLVPFGNVFPIKEQFHCRTQWTNDGMPVSIKSLTIKERNLLQQSISDSSQTLNESYLYGLPEFTSQDDFIFFSSKTEQLVTFGDVYCRFLGGSKCEKTRRFACKGTREEIANYNIAQVDEDHYYDSLITTTPTLHTNEDSEDTTHEYFTELSSPISPCGYGLINDDLANYFDKELNDDEIDGEEEWDDDDDEDQSDENSDQEEEDSEEEDSEEEDSDEEDVRPRHFAIHRQYKRQDTPVPTRQQTQWEESFYSSPQ